MSTTLVAGEPIFHLVKIDGPRHEPEKKTFWYGPFSEGSAVFDVDGDGHLDITCGPNWYQGPDWKKHEGFRPSAKVKGEFINNCGEYAFDVNGDGRVDLVSAGWMENGVWWYENPGPAAASTEWKATKIVSSDWTEGLIVEDIDGDGDLDVLPNHWKNKPGQSVMWLENHGAARFEAHALGTKGDRHGIGLGDLDGDGRKDIITPDGWYRAPEKAGDEWRFYNDFRLEHHGGIRMLVLDVNGDGRNDIVWGHGHNYGLGWFEQQPAGAVIEGRMFDFREHLVEDSLGQFHTLVLADVNQDGTLDLVTGKRLRGHGGGDPSGYDPLGVFWYEIDGGRFRRHVLAYNHVFWYPRGAPAFEAPQVAVGTGMNINVVDVDKDDLVDIVVSGKSGLYLFKNRGLPPTKKLQ